MTESPCGSCYGSGRCAGCHGYGKRVRVKGAWFRRKETVLCSVCRGTGACPSCCAHSALPPPSPVKPPPLMKI